MKRANEPSSVSGSEDVAMSRADWSPCLQRHHVSLFLHWVVRFSKPQSFQDLTVVSHCTWTGRGLAPSLLTEVAESSPSFLGLVPPSLDAWVSHWPLAAIWGPTVIHAQGTGTLTTRRSHVSPMCLLKQIPKVPFFCSLLLGMKLKALVLPWCTNYSIWVSISRFL